MNTLTAALVALEERPAERGFQGERGFEGKAGLNGQDGLDGNPGPKGDPGPEGKAGSIGLAGRDGLPGTPGQVGKDGLSINWRGPWMRGAFLPLDAVEWEGSSYICTARTNSKPPSPDWDLMAQRGADGQLITTGWRGGGGAGAGAVTSVNGQAGVVVLGASDVGADATGAAAAAQAASQPLDSDLTAIAALSTTSFGRSHLTEADASAGRTLLGLGTLATQSGTFSGTSSGTNTGDQALGAAGPLVTVRTAAGVPSGAPSGTELPIAFDTTAVSGGLYCWSGSAWVYAAPIPPVLTPG